MWEISFSRCIKFRHKKCKKYENDVYTECSKDLPKLGKNITIPEGTGRVIAVDILNKTFKVDIKDKGIIEVKK